MLSLSYLWGGFVQDVCVRERESGGRRLDAGVGSPLEGGREVAGAIVVCAEGLVHVRVFGTGGVNGLYTDSDLDNGDFMAEACFGVGEVRGRDVQYLVTGEL